MPGPHRSSALTRIVLGALVFFVPRAAAAQSPPPSAPSLAVVLERAADYVNRYKDDLSAVVLEEQYNQDVIVVPSAMRTAQTPAVLHRELLSDVLFVRSADGNSWAQFRDVFQVDGKAVRDRSERLLKLFVGRTRASADQIADIQRESARFNIGTVDRTTNMPILALMFLDRRFQDRFTFTKVNPGSPKPFAGLVARESDIWGLEYREVKEHTLIRGAFNRDLPSRGRFWIDAATGAVLRMELILEDSILANRVDVTFAFDPGLAMLVPAEMQERVSLRSGSTSVRGRARYGRFRKFQVQTDENIGSPIQ